MDFWCVFLNNVYNMLNLFISRVELKIVSKFVFPVGLMGLLSHFQLFFHNPTICRHFFTLSSRLFTLPFCFYISFNSNSRCHLWSINTHNYFTIISTKIHYEEDISIKTESPFLRGLKKKTPQIWCTWCTAKYYQSWTVATWLCFKISKL